MFEMRTQTDILMDVCIKVLRVDTACKIHPFKKYEAKKNNSRVTSRKRVLSNFPIFIHLNY